MQPYTTAGSSAVNQNCSREQGRQQGRLGLPEVEVSRWWGCGVQASRIDTDWEGVEADLKRIRDTLLQRQGAMVNMTADQGTLSSLRPHLDSFLSSLPAQSAAPVSWGQTLQPINEAITVPTQASGALLCFGSCLA